MGGLGARLLRGLPEAARILLQELLILRDTESRYFHLLQEHDALLREEHHDNEGLEEEVQELRLAIQQMAEDNEILKRRLADRDAELLELRRRHEQRSQLLEDIRSLARELQEDIG